MNLGLPSDTATGLSEPDHPFPRPNVHDRIDRAIELTKPDVVVICYGMNDGIYSPFDEGRFKKYQDGITRAVEKAEKAGAKVVLMTPPPFDPKPLKDKLLAKDAPKYSWLRPYERYDEEVLTKYAEWLLTLREKKYPVIDLHAVLLRHVAAVRKDDPNYTVSPDGIHFNADGHLVAALELLKVWHAPGAVKEIVIDFTKDPPTKSDVTIVGQRGFSFALPRAMPADPDWSPLAKKAVKFEETVNRYRLQVDGPKGFLAISVQRDTGGKKGDARRVATTAEKLSAGLDLGEVLQVVPDPKGGELFKLIDEKNRVLGPAWLSHVGHKRPDTPKGLPIEEARKKAAALDEQVRRLCKPEEYTLGVGPSGK